MHVCALCVAVLVSACGGGGGSSGASGNLSCYWSFGADGAAWSGGICTDSVEECKDDAIAFARDHGVSEPERSRIGTTLLEDGSC